MQKKTLTLNIPLQKAILKVSTRSK